MKKGILLFALTAMQISLIFAQTASLKGTIKGADEALSGVNVVLSNTAFGTVTDAAGNYKLENLPAGDWTIQISFIGYRKQEIPVSLTAGATLTQDFIMQEDVLGLEAVVVSATRNTVPLHEAPVIVNRIDDRIFERTQSLSLSEGLNFSPGLRLETNCQNCGFTQLRMNGLDGPYTQILINSRPIFSALMGVYGLDMIPANMVERVEVIRGGGSALYGGNAIGGTVNIITKDPLFNSFEIGTNLAYTNLEQPDRTLSLNGAIVSDDLRKGLSFYAYNRDRLPWDANGDDFSEITKLQNTTFGFDAFYKPDEWSKIKLNVFSISEFRRGGNRFDLPPHQTDITEQLDHKILGSGLSYERFSKNYKHKFALYTSMQLTDRSSYYGGGGRVLGPQDVLTESDLLAINAYGQSEDLSLIGGLQYSHDFNEHWLLTAGGEYQYNDVLDKMPGYNREIDQQVGVAGSYVQLQWKPTDKWLLLLGGRYDRVKVDGVYGLDVEKFADSKTFNIAVPRFTAMYSITPDWKLRASYAQGYRAPQAFDEDLHIETVGGAALFTRLDPNLEIERSNSLNASLDYTFRKGKFESNFVLDGFYTRLNNPFITADQEELPSGVAIVTKRNGGGAVVSGLNAEANLAFSSKFVVQLGATLQSARYDDSEEIWTPAEPTDTNQDSVITTINILRTPTAYGFITANWVPVKRLSLSLSSVYTGAMNVPHTIDPETEYTIIERTPSFLELNFRIAYKLNLSKQFYTDLFAGVQNIFNSYQDDFDLGAERDSNYIYGPSRPRTAFFGLKFHFE